jgi:two-component system, NtrC family, response regulator AtoC
VISDFEDSDTDGLGERGRGSRLQAVISVGGSVTTRLLPSSGEVTIGRASSCDLVINHASVSRQHAMLRMSPLEIIDVGSRNGTCVRGTRLERGIPTAIEVGEAIQVGEASVLIHSSAGAEDKPVEAAPEQADGLDLLRAECVRSARTCSPFALVQLEIDEGRPRDAHAVLRALLRESDVVRNEGNGALQVVLVDTRGDAIEVAVSRMVDQLYEHGIVARIGVARYPEDGVVAEQLLAHAYEQLDREPGAPPTAMDNVRGMLHQVATGDLSVLLIGETGVGKELCAEMIHRLSPRAARPFVKLNCSALVESLIESELFGHERGAFTGATSAHEGLLETANGGTVFLDEIGELPIGVQSKLLRVLEEQLVRRVGASTARKVDARFVCATNRDLAEEVEAGRFRRDLYYRINGVTLAIPPLRERKSEIVPLARAFARRARPGAALTFGKEVVAELEYNSWKGNIRELRNSIERAVLMSSGGTIRPSHLSLDTRDRSRDSAVTMPVELVANERGSRNRISSPTLPMDRSSSPAISTESQDSRSLANAVRDLERQRIIDALEQCGGNQTRAARILGISRNTLVARLEEFGLPRPRKAR